MSAHAHIDRSAQTRASPIVSISMALALAGDLRVERGRLFPWIYCFIVGSGTTGVVLFFESGE
jgi:hypothetical protein